MLCRKTQWGHSHNHSYLSTAMYIIIHLMPDQNLLENDHCNTKIPIFIFNKVFLQESILF